MWRVVDGGGLWSKWVVKGVDLWRVVKNDGWWRVWWVAEGVAFGGLWVLWRVVVCGGLWEVAEGCERGGVEGVVCGWW